MQLRRVITVEISGGVPLADETTRLEAASNPAAAGQTRTGWLSRPTIVFVERKTPKIPFAVAVSPLTSAVCGSSDAHRHEISLAPTPSAGTT